MSQRSITNQQVRYINKLQQQNFTDLALLDNCLLNQSMNALNALLLELLDGYGAPVLGYEFGQLVESLAQFNESLSELSYLKNLQEDEKSWLFQLLSAQKKQLNFETPAPVDLIVSTTSPMLINYQWVYEELIALCHHFRAQAEYC